VGSLVKVVTDSIANLPAEMVAELGITVIPTLVRFGNQAYRDGIDLTVEEFYAKLAREPSVPATSQPPVGVFEEVYRQLGQETRQIISIHAAAKVSGIFSTAYTATQSLPDLEIAIIDSTNISMAQGWLVVKAARLAREGKSLPEIVPLVQDAVPRVRLIAVVDTLEYAVRGGRLGKGKAFFGTLLQVKPILQVYDGEVLPLENTRTKRRALQRLIEITAQMAPFEEVAVPHTNAPALAGEVREKLAPYHPIERIPVVEAGPVVGAHAGPGAVGVASVIKRVMSDA
jgi:DegV family protein with EDD domain